MQWNHLDSQSKLEDAIVASQNQDVLLFKHSTTCSISAMAKMRLENNWSFSPDVLLPYYLDLKVHRNLSNEIAERFSVAHESPQVLIIRKNECIYDASHFDISTDEIKETLEWHARTA